MIILKIKRSEQKISYPAQLKKLLQIKSYSQTSWNNSIIVIEKLLIKNFRNFQQREVSFWAWKNIIIWNNWHGKTNILEALALPVSPLIESKGEYLVKKWESILHLNYQFSSGSSSYSYDLNDKKKRFFLGKSLCTRPKFLETYPHVVSFHPLVMNMMYLSPSERRDFLDQTLIQSHSSYKKNLWEYKKVLLSRNRVLKNIFEKKSSPSELDFWNEKFIQSASSIYTSRKMLIDFLSTNISELEKYFFWKVQQVEFIYSLKIDIWNPKASLKSYIENNTQKEILARRTCVWPHLDDFDILLDWTPLIHFASRGEVKSSILALKFLESAFIQSSSDKKDILFLIDDLLSELDHEHRDMLWKHIWKRQCIVSSIEDSEVDGTKIFI